MSESKFTPYPQYKDSGVSWLGEVPYHWQVLPGKACLRERKVPNKGMQETTVLTLSYGQIKVRPPEKLHGLVPESFETYQIVEPGDIIFRPTDLQNDWVSLRFGISKDRGIITSAYLCLRTRENLNREFGHLLLHAYDLNKVFYGLGSGLRQNIDWQDFKYLPCIVPPLDEQAAIVRYLDHMDRRIHRYILSRQKIIKLLNEQKQAIIHQAVTRGLDPNVRLKPSGVEWLGDIPEHWDILRSKYLLREIDLRSISGNETHLSMSQRLGLIPQNQVEEKRLISESYAGGKLCEENDLVLNRLKAHLGVFAVAKQPGVVSPDYTIFRQVQPISMRYYEMILRSPGCRIEFRKRAKGIVQGFWRLYTDDFYEIRLPFPPLAEQMSIVKFIDGKCSTIDELIYSCQQEIKLLQDYQRRLISDVVTGKEDILKIANQLSNEPEVEMIIQELDEVEEEVVEDVVGEETVDED